MKALFISLTLGCVTTSSFAAYKCNFDLAKDGIKLSQTSISANSGVATGGYLGLLLTEVSKGDISKNSSKYVRKELVIGGKILGWDEKDSGQKAIINIGRSHIGVKRDRFVSLEGDKAILVDNLELTGEETKTVAFENYKLTISCGHAEDESMFQLER